MTPAFQYLKTAYKKDGDKLLSRACCNRTRGNGFKLKKMGIFGEEIKVTFSMMKEVKHCHRLPRGEEEVQVAQKSPEEVPVGYQEEFFSQKWL